MPAALDLSGVRFTRLVAQERAGRNAGVIWRCLCDCGNTTFVKTAYLRFGHTKSCGCLVKDTLRRVGPTANRTHGKSKQPTWESWYSMIRRCENPFSKTRAYARYGARGIRVCARWLTFTNFLADMGEKSPGMTLDRIDGTKGYSPENCRWADRTQQARNVSSNRLIEMGGETYCLAEWCERYGASYLRVHARLKYGWPLKQALTLPLHSKFTGAKNV